MKTFTGFTYLLFLLIISSAGHAAEWGVSGEWVTMNNSRSFPLGIWPAPSMTAEDFGSADMVYVHRTADYSPDTMRGKTLMIGSSHFQWVFGAGYNGGIPGYVSNRDAVIDYDEMRSLGDTDPAIFERYIDRTVLQPWKAAVDTVANPDFCWFTIDEPDHFGYGRRTWCWSPELIRRMAHAVKAGDDGNDLVVVSLGPPNKGNVFFYDANIPPLIPPPKKPSFAEGYELHFDNSTGDRLDPGRYFNTLRLTVSAYRAADVWMINDYHTFYRAPEYAGIAVDAIHAADCDNGKTVNPVWLWFNPGLIDYHPSYGVDRFRCQIFTAIAHGCAGVFMFCTDNPGHVDHLSRDEWRIAKDILSELNGRREFLVGDPVQKGSMKENRIHYSIRTTTSGLAMLLTNTSDVPMSVDLHELHGVHGFPDAVRLAPYDYRFLTADQ